MATTNGIYYECRYCDLFGKELNMVTVLSGFVVFDILWTCTLMWRVTMWLCVCIAGVCLWWVVFGSDACVSKMISLCVLQEAIVLLVDKHGGLHSFVIASLIYFWNLCIVCSLFVLCLHLCLSVCLFPTLSYSFSFSLPLSFPLPPSLPPPLSFSLTLSLSPSLKVSSQNQSQLRAAVCCSLPPEPSPSLESRLKEEGYNIGTFPDCTKALITEFPYRTSTSILIAVSRVYPALHQYMKVREKRQWVCMGKCNGILPY